MSLVVHSKVWAEFLETPIAMLTEYGLLHKAANQLEKRYGLYISCIQSVTPDELRRLPNFAEKTLASLSQSLNQLLHDLMEEETGHNGHRIFPTNQRAIGANGKGAFASRNFAGARNGNAQNGVRM